MRLDKVGERAVGVAVGRGQRREERVSQGGGGLARSNLNYLIISAELHSFALKSLKLPP